MSETGRMAAYAYPGPQAPADPTNVMGRRIGAFFIDAAIVVAVAVLCFFPFATKRTVNETLDLPGCHRRASDFTQIECDNRAVFRVGDDVYEADFGPTFLLNGAFSILYFGVFQGLTGATVGKYLTNIRVVDESGAIANIGRSLLRWLLFAVDGPISLYLCGLLTSLLSKGHRRLGDMAAGTYVVARSSVGQPIVIGAPPVPIYAGVPGPGAAPTPQWDPARNAYVQWDAATGRYVTWDPASQTWR